MIAVTHECPIDGCTAKVDHDKLMCLKHWRLVPKPLAAAVWNTWRRVNRDPNAYRDAREAAIAHVEARDANHHQGSLL